MVQTMRMPKLGMSSESSLIGQWLKQKGDYVKQGEPLVTVETDKSVFEVESEVEGYVLELLYREGDEVNVLEPIAVIGEQGAIYQKESAEQKVVAIEPEPVNKVEESASKLMNAHVAESRIKISPRAKMAAQKRRIPLEELQGTGPNARIIEADILAYSKPGKERVVEEHSPKQGFKELSNMRKIIAKNMMNSLQQSAQLTLNTSFDARVLLKLRERFKTHKNESFQGISMNDMVLLVISRVLKDYPSVNAHIEGTTVKEFDEVHLGVALDLPRGLIVPTLFHTDRLSLVEIAKQMRKTYEKCKDNAILPEELQGATFTVTNLGALGVESFTPILNPPQVAILGICTIIYKVKLVDGEQVVYPSIPLSLTFDHRALDGAPAARFLKDLVDGLENIDVLMAL